MQILKLCSQALRVGDVIVIHTRNEPAGGIQQAGIECANNTGCRSFYKPYTRIVYPRPIKPLGQRIQTGLANQQEFNIRVALLQNALYGKAE